MSETEKFITLHAGFGSYGERVTDFTVMPKQEAQYAIQPLASMCIDQVRAYGPRGSKPRIVSVSLDDIGGARTDRGTGACRSGCQRFPLTNAACR